jgi:nicotinamide riboside kinase
MKIVFCGAHGVGKTTLASRLAEHLQVPLLPDIVPQAHALGFEINEGTPLETQLRLTGKQLEQEKMHQDFVADKCIFDYYVYAKALEMDENLTETIRKVALKTQKYDHIFFIAPEFPIEDDGLRSTNIAFQTAVHEVYKEFLDIYMPTAYTVLTGSVEERFEQIFEVM